MPRSTLVPLCVFLLLSFAVANAQIPTFLETPTYHGSGPIAVADFNLDGHPDIVNGSGGVLLNNGDGTFRNGITLNVPAVAGAIGTADFNGDGKPDVVFIPNTEYPNIMVFLGNGDGTFQKPILTNPGTQYVGPIAVADVNGDGKPDLLADTGNGFQVFLGKGDGTFSVLAPGPEYLGVTGDFNNDGKLDVAWGDGVGGIAVAAGNGDGTFQKAIISDPSVQNAIVFAAGDFNNDGKLDLLLSYSVNYSPIWAVVLGNGDGTFQSPSPAIPFPAIADMAAVGDFNGDGKLDLLLSAYGNVASVLLGNGDGTFSAGQSYVANPNGYGAANIVLADFNGDHKLDAAVSSTSSYPPQGATAILIGNGDGTLQGQAAPVALSSITQATVAADFNGDGKPDLAGPSGDGIEVFINTGSGTEFTAYNQALPSNEYASSVVAADVNGDGKMDLVVGSNNYVANTESVIVLLGNGDGTFGAPAVFPFAQCISGAGCYGVNAALGDFNGDHKLDVAAVPTGYWSDQLYVLLGNGDGTFGPPSAYYVGNGSSSALVATADFNLDGKLDIAVSGSFGIGLLLGNGDGTFQNVTFLGAGLSLDVVADLNGDGKPDMVTRNTSARQIQVLLGNGDGTFKALPPFGQYGIYTAADLNGDGKLDLVGGALGYAALVYPGNGDGTFGSPTRLPTGGLVGDFNGDGKPDLASTPDSWLTILFNTTAADFVLAPAPGSKTSATVNAGQGATYNLIVSSFGWFSGTANLTCSVTPTVTPAPTCSVPGSVNVAKYGTVPFQLKAGTTAPTTMGSLAHPGLPPGAMPFSWAVIWLAAAMLYGVGRQRRAVAPAVMVFALLAFVGCGGGSSSSSSSSSQMIPGTPAGTYTITVTAKSGNLQHSTTVTLIVD